MCEHGGTVQVLVQSVAVSGALSYHVVRQCVGWTCRQQRLAIYYLYEIHFLND